MLARSTAPSNIVIGTLHMLTMAWAGVARSPQASRQRTRTWRRMQTPTCRLPKTDGRAPDSPLPVARAGHVRDDVEVGQDPVAHRAEERDELAGGFVARGHDGRMDRASQHREQHLGLALAGEGIFGQALEQILENTGDQQSYAHDLLDEETAM